MTQICKICKVDKDIEAFEAEKWTKRNGERSRRAVCRTCVYHHRRGEVGSERHQQSLEKARHQKKNKGRLKVLERLAWVDAKKDKPCEDCKQKFPPECMDFDHIDPSSKLFNISSGIQSAHYHLDKIQLEIDKCRLICANCHRIRTAVYFRRGWKPSEVIGLERPKKYGRITKDLLPIAGSNVLC